MRLAAAYRATGQCRRGSAGRALALGRMSATKSCFVGVRAALPWICRKITDTLAVVLEGEGDPRYSVSVITFISSTLLLQRHVMLDPMCRRVSPEPAAAGRYVTAGRSTANP